MPVTTTAIYAALLAALYIALSVNVSATRGKTGIGFGDAGNPVMLAAVRRQANMAEHVPFALLLMALAELNGLGAAWLHGAGITLVASRLIHPFGVRANNSAFAARVIGTLGTYAAMAIAAVSLVVHWLG